VIRDEILQDLRNGMPWDEVKRKYSSQSQMYEAFRIFSEEMEKRLNEGRENLRKVQEKLSKANDDFQSVQSKKTKVADEVAKLRQERDQLKAEVGNMTEKRDQLCLEVKRLKKEGYTPEILKKLKLADAKSGLELLSRVQTAEKHDELQSEVGGLEKKNSNLKSEIRALEVKEKSIEQQIISEGNVLDELKRKTASYKRAR
jgi:predicted  nucleic acid-binding Zn-ribbon protein